MHLVLIVRLLGATYSRWCPKKVACQVGSTAVQLKEKYCSKKLKLNSSSQNPGQGKQNQAILILAILLGTSVFFNFFSITAISLVVFLSWQGKLSNFSKIVPTKDLDMNLRSFTYEDLEEPTSGFKKNWVRVLLALFIKRY